MTSLLSGLKEARQVVAIEREGEGGWLVVDWALRKAKASNEVYSLFIEVNQCRAAGNLMKWKANHRQVLAAFDRAIAELEAQAIPERAGQ